MDKREQAMADNIYRVLERAAHDTPRSQQTKEHKLGVSDLGMCREYVKHMVIQSPQVEPERSMLPAMIGSAWDEYVKPAICGPVVEEVSGEGWAGKRTANGYLVDVWMQITLPSGKTVEGTCDALNPATNTLVDFKTVNGLTYVRREGASVQQQFQRRIYTFGAIQHGLLDGTKDVFCGNVWWDRSAVETKPVVQLEEYGDWMMDEVDAYLGDVDYAVMHNEEAGKDKPLTFCMDYCPFFQVCRAEDLTHDGGIVDDPDGQIESFAALYNEGAGLIKQGKQMQDEAKATLKGVNGATANFTITTTHIPGADVPGYQRAGYDRLTIRPIRR
jgi:hypothetical protein